jgi:hypothetical protein
MSPLLIRQGKQELNMIILAALLASAQVLPGIDRSWLSEQARIEALVTLNQKRPLKLAPRRAAAPLVISYQNNVVGM